MIFKIIPSIPDYTVSQEHLLEIEQYLADKFPTKEIKAEQYDTIQFIDCGENFERVLCGDCHDTVDIEFWQESMSKSYETGFYDRTIEMSCCGGTSALDKLVYEQPQGFAKLIIQIDDMMDDEMDQEIIEALQGFMEGTPIRIINAKY